MKKTKLITIIKWLIALIIAVEIGTFFTDTLERTHINVWIARTIGCGICVVIGLLIYGLWLNKDNKKEIK